MFTILTIKYDEKTYSIAFISNRCSGRFSPAGSLGWLSIIYIAIGDKDFLYEANKEYRQMLDAKNYPYEYFETGEGHIWKNWRIYLSEFAPKLFKK